LLRRAQVGPVVAICEAGTPPDSPKTMTRRHLPGIRTSVVIPACADEAPVAATRVSAGPFLKWVQSRRTRTPSPPRGPVCRIRLLVWCG
jgi:hypothetical protein